MITSIHVENFRSLKLLDVEVPPLMFICGPNGTGKTNFSEALDFISLAFQRGLSYAVADKGGFFNMCFRRARRSKAAISFRVKGTEKLRDGEVEIDVSFSLQTRGEAIRSDYFVEAESYRFIERTNPSSVRAVRIWRDGERYQFDTTKNDQSDDEPWGIERLVRIIFGRETGMVTNDRSLLFPSPFGSFLPFSAELTEMTSIRVFRINPRTARQSGTPSISGELGKYGENLPSALDNLAVNYSKTFTKLEELIKEVIPGLTSLRTSYTASRQMGLFVDEAGFGGSWDAEELSDGTLMSIALFLSLLDPRYQCVVVEEPENSLHPWILRKFLECAKELSNKKQIIITTQSPFVISVASPHNLFVVERHHGETEIVSALKKDPILPEMLKRQFLDLGSYWTSGALGGVPGPEEETGESDSDQTVEPES